MRSFVNLHALAAAAILLPAALLAADADTKVHNPPVSAQASKNPYAGREEAAQAGKMHERNYLSCHGKTGKGTGKTSSQVNERPDSVTPGELLWLISRDDKDNPMPPWASLPVKPRWQIVNYVKSMATSQPA